MSIPGSASPLFFQTAAADAAAAGPIKSVRFNTADSSYLNRTPSSNGNRTVWTLSCWIKLNKLDTTHHILTSVVSSTNDSLIKINGNNHLEIYNYPGSYNTHRITDAKFRDPSAWYSIIVSQNGSTGINVWVNGVAQTFSTSIGPGSSDWLFNSTTAQQIGRYNTNVLCDYQLADFYWIDGEAKDKTDFGSYDDNGVWQAKAYSGSFGTNGFHLFDFANESGIGNDSSGNDNDFSVNNITLSAANYANATTTASSGEVPNGSSPYWIDIVPTNADLDYDGGSTGMQRVHDGSTTTEVYWVGDQYSSGNVTRARFDLRDYSSISTLRVYGGFSGYTAYNYQLLDSSKSAISGTSGSFGAIGWHSLTVSGSPRYLEISCTSGSNRRLRLYAIEVNGTVLTSSDPSNTDVLFDVPTNGDSSNDTGAGGEVSGNYATLNPNITGTYISRSTLSNGNLKFVNTQYSTLPSTIAMSSGKWYCEGTLDALASASNQVWAGLLRADAPNNAYEYFQGNNPTRGVHFWGDNTGLNRTQSYGASYATAGTVIGIAFDADAGSCTWYINGSSQGASTYNIVQGKEYYFSFGAYVNGAWTVNFGQRPFAYSAPSGYKPLCTTLLPTPTIADGSDYFDTKIWTGTGSTLSITGYEFSPDFVWIKNRSDTSHHHIYDAIRGVEKRLKPNSTDVEDDYASSNPGSSLTSFNSNGFTVGDFNGINGSSDAMVGWAWDAGSSTVSNTDGSITSSVRANQTAGFSIVSYTGTGSAATVGHGLNAAPELLIIKNRDGAHQWPVYFKVLGAGNKLQLNDTAASASTSHFNSTDPTSSVFSVGGTSSANNNNEDHIAYCFAPVSGYSAFGSFNTNNNANGPFVYTGFRPAFILYRYSSTTGNWAIFDSKRNTYNVMDNYLFANTNAAEASSSNIDFLSNGFKFRISLPSGNNIVYACFAENPFQANGGLAR